MALIAVKLAVLLLKMKIIPSVLLFLALVSASSIPNKLEKRSGLYQELLKLGKLGPKVADEGVTAAGIKAADSRIQQFTNLKNANPSDVVLPPNSLNIPSTKIPDSSILRPQGQQTDAWWKAFNSRNAPSNIADNVRRQANPSNPPFSLPSLPGGKQTDAWWKAFKRRNAPAHLADNANGLRNSNGRLVKRPWTKRKVRELKKKLQKFSNPLESIPE